MEDDFRQATSPEMADFVSNELTRSNSNASSLTAENSEGILHQSPDNLTTWTNEKHNLYLDHLEVSFVEQLQQSVGLLSSCFEQHKSDKHLSRKWNSDVNIASDQLTALQNGSWQKIDYGRGHPFLHTSTDTSDARKSSQLQQFGHMCNQCPPASAALQESLGLRSTEKHVAVEGIVSQGLETYPHQFPANNLYIECSGQNFVDEDSQENSANRSYAKRLRTALADNSSNNFVDEDSQENSANRSRAKRLRTALADNSSNDQIVPSLRCPTTDNACH